jgi:hypothetical protein
MACLSPKVTAFESEETEEDRLSVTLEHRTVLLENEDESFVFSPKSDLDLDFKLNDLFSTEFTFSLNENHNYLGVGENETGIQRAALVFEYDGWADHRFEAGLLGHAREFRTSRAGANIGLDSPLSIDLPFREERLDEFAGVRYDINIPLGNKWSVSFNATAGRSFKDNVELDRFDVLSNLVHSGAPTGPFFRSETLRAVNGLFDKVEDRSGEYFSSLRDDISARDYEINADRLINRANDLTNTIRRYDEGLADRLSNEVDDLNLHQLEQLGPEQIRAGLTQAVNQLEGKVNEALVEYRAQANTRINEISDEEFNDTVLLIAKHLHDLGIYFDEKIPLYEQIAAAGYLETYYGDGVSNRELAEYLMALKAERANSNDLSSMFGVSVNRYTEKSCLSFGVNAGTLKSDGFRMVDEQYASAYVDGCRHFNERVSLSYTGELAYFNNYRHIEDLEYGLLSLSSALRWEPEALPDVTLHGRLGVTADALFGPSAHTELGASYMVFENERGSLELMGSVGYIKPIEPEIEVDEYFESLTFHTSPTTAVSFGLRAKF